MKTLEYRVTMDVDDDGRIVRSDFVGASTEPGTSATGHDSLDRCAIALRKEFRREALGRDFDRIIAQGAAVHVAEDAA